MINHKDYTEDEALKGIIELAEEILDDINKGKEKTYSLEETKKILQKVI